MAYSEKYFHQYCDSYGSVCRISIQEQDFVGTPIELEGQPDPFLIIYESSGDFLYEPIRPSSAEINLTLGTGNGVDLEDFWTADEKQFKIIHTINSNVDWVGYVIPNGFEYELRGGIYYASLQASDGLSTLEKLPFVQEDGNPYNSGTNLNYNDGIKFPYSLIATEILKKLGLELETWIAIDVYDTSLADAVFNLDDRISDPWSTSYVNINTYINRNNKKDQPYWVNKDEPFNCKEVIESALRTFGAIMFQQSGSWRIIRVNIYEAYLYRGNQRYWKRYNTTSDYLGREILDPNFGKDFNIIHCGSQAEYTLSDAVVRMDDVYSAYRINYEYTFTRFGDQPVELIKNGTFQNIGFGTPSAGTTNWMKWRDGNKWFPRARQVAASSGPNGSLPPGLGNNSPIALEIGTSRAGVNESNLDPNAAVWAGIRQTPNPTVTKGDKIDFGCWVKMKLRSERFGVYYVGMIKIRLYGNDGNNYYLTNTEPDASFSSAINTQWTKEENDPGIDRWFLRLYKDGFFNDSPIWEQYNWYQLYFNVPDIPETGRLEFTIHGLAATEGRISDNFRAFIGKPSTPGAINTETKHATVRKDWVDEGGDIPRFQITAIRFNIIEANTDERPTEEQSYIYENPNENYTLDPDPVTILNGDGFSLSEEVISHIESPDGFTSVNEPIRWRPYDVPNYKSGPIGLITAQSIMNQYYLPNRIFEGTVRTNNAEFGIKYEFNGLFNDRVIFKLNRATLNRKRNYIQDATFRQIALYDHPPNIPSDEQSDPDWQPTGRRRCVKDGSGSNTGEIEAQEIDQNPWSETYRQLRWVSGGENTDVCPIGEKTKYYWCSDVDPLDSINLVYDPFFIDNEFPNEVQVSFNNTGNKYLYFVHRDDLGTIERIYTSSQPNNIISDWSYQTDITIDGQTYNVIRTNYVLAEFQDFSFNFVFNTPQI